MPGNYDIQRSYKLNITFHYKFTGGLTKQTIAAQTVRFESLFNTVSSLLGFVSECNGIIISREKIVSSPPGVESVFFNVHLKFTASDSVADDQVHLRLTTCIDTLNSTYKGFLDVNAPRISQGGVTKRNYNLSTLSDKESTCGKRIPLPCCAVGATVVSSTKCGKSSRECKYAYYHPGDNFWKILICHRLLRDFFNLVPRVLSLLRESTFSK